MSKNEFLKELESRLNGLPSEDIKERVAFYEEMINDRLEEGKSEEEALKEIGTVDEIVEQITKETPLVKLVKERVKPKRRIQTWEIVLIAVGFPLWLPLLITAFALIMVAYILVWTLVIVTYTVELATSVAGLAAIIAGAVAFFSGAHWYGVGLAAGGVMCIGFSILFIFACIGATKASIALTKAIILSIKKKFVSRR